MNAELVFQCSGRDCGPSTYWANKIYQKALLYGPEQYQRYIVCKSKRCPGLLSAYLHWAKERRVKFTFSTRNYSPKPMKTRSNQYWLKITELFSPLKFDEEFDENLIEKIENIVANTESQYILVVHDKMRDSESFDQALNRTEERAFYTKRTF